MTAHAFGRKGLRFFSVLAFLAANLTFVPAVLAAPAGGDLEQCRNGTAASPNACAELGGSAGWVSGNVGASQAHLVEGYSIPYRYVMENMPIGSSVTLVLGYDIKHSGAHAIDYLTHYDRLEPHVPLFGHAAEDVLPLSGVSGVSATTSTIPIDPPSSAGSPVAGQPTTSFNNLVVAEGAGAAVMTLFGGTLSDFSYVSQGNLNAAQSETRISVTFTLNSSTAVLAWGGHIGSREDWGFNAGVPRSAGGISGSPYHMRTISWNLNNLGNTDRSMSAQAVIAPPAVTVVKTANPLTLPEPGGNFTFSVAVTNTGIQNVTLTSLTDDIYGDLLNDAGNPLISGSTCVDNTPIAPSATYNCSFVGAFTGNAGASQTDIVTGTVTNSTGVTATDTDDAIVSLTDVAPTLSVDKTANPTSVAEPGGSVTFTVVVTNLSNEPVDITSLEDDIHGVLVGDADCAVGTTLAASGDAGDSCTFDFTEDVTGDAGDSETDTVEACVNDGDSAVDVCDDDPATVTITDVAPTLSVDKTANPTSVAEPGGSVTFTVVVTNLSNEPVDITSLEDDIHGVLVGDADCAVGTTLAASGDAGDSCTFDFTEDVTGDAGDSETDTVEACVNDGDSAVDVCDDDPATVTITDVAPTLSVDKTANPTSVAEPGGSVTFTVVVTNLSNEPVDITSLEDDIHGVLVGDADCAVGTTLAASGDAGDSCTFDFTEDVTGDAGDSETDTVEACVNDGDSAVDVCDDDPATVTITDVAPTLSVDKTANPTSVAEPGGSVTFTVVVTNLSNEPVDITSLEDDIHGVLVGDADCAVGTTLAASGDAGDSCTFDFTEDVTGDAGDSETDTVEACVNDGDSAVDVCDDDPATVTITDVGFTIDVDKSSDPTTVQAPGGTVTFTVDVTNNSAIESVTLTSLVDNVYGDLFDDAGNALISNSTCVDNSVIAAGDTYTCTFDATVSGSGGDSHTNTVTGCATDGENPDCDDGSTTVTITEPPGGNLFHTGTTCDQFLGNDPPSGLAGQEINQVNYSVKAGKISQLDPGVFFYFTEITASGASLVATIEQTPPAGYNNPFSIQNASNVRVFDANCNSYSNFTIGSLANGDVTVTINGTTAGSDYIISVKYETSSLKGKNPPPTDPSAAWNFATVVGGVTVDSDDDGIVLKRK